MSNNMPKLVFDPIIEFKAQEFGIETEKVATFISIVEDEITKSNERIVVRGLDSGLEMEEILTLLQSLAETTGIDVANKEMFIVEDAE